MTTTTPVAPAGEGLRLSGIRKAYGGVQALRGVEFTVDSGEIHALVGENGAGKSTLIKIISGAESPDTGTVLLGSTVLVHGSTGDALDAGIATVYQDPRLFGELTVTENVFIGRELRRRGRVDWARQRQRVAEVFTRLGVDPQLADVRVADLAVAEQQLVSIAKAFARDARILILDEPSAILTDREINRLFTALRGLREHGVGVIYISHRLDEIARIADRVTVLRDGQVVATRSTQDTTVRQIAELMVGRPLSETAVTRPRPGDGHVLEVRGLSRSGRFENVDLDVRPREIVALYGLVGSGTDAVAHALSGLDPAARGSVRIDGEPVATGIPEAAARAGLALLPANRQVQGVFADKSIAFNISVGHLRRLSRAFWFDRGAEASLAADFMKRLAVKAPTAKTPIGRLSGGNQQKVVLARQLAGEPRVLVLEEPTQGVDIGAKAEIHQLVFDLADAGNAVLLVSTDLPEVLQLADRLLVLRGGGVVGEFGRGASQADVLATAAGEKSQERAAAGTTRQSTDNQQEGEEVERS
ncbi:sugar ABC transporter ATP-binding protein [Streptomyces canus]|uniref:sugar ABC transporter ATP-binding protein n=1 Tax=Streptomyces canus TaxID=58343 RepID=UPI00278B07BD|nr:sugar ABC transporter ATP-binding protein [Streptomyces canus]MDQ0765526.1 rhamnose transport system ATP-binding protein [Streptomyces canus]